MVHKLICVIIVTVTAFIDAKIPNPSEFLASSIAKLLSPLDGLDGPASISNAPTTYTSKNKLPDLDQLKYYNYYSASTYYGYDLKNLTCEYCLKFSEDVDEHKVLSNGTHNTLALVTLSNERKEIVVAFRGTWNVWNAVIDALAIATRIANTPSQLKVHRGFYIAVMSLYNQVVHAIETYLDDNEGFKVVITGHSLGAAMARLTYFFLEENKQFPTVTYEVYTYGEPRVGNKFFADFMNSQPITTARVVNRGDVVPHIPPVSILGTKLIGDYYVHPQTEFWIHGEKSQQYCSRALYEDPTCSMSLGPLFNIVDHALYFDTNLGSVIGQPFIAAYLPGNLLDPTTDLPPLPKPIEKSLGKFGQGVLGAASPWFG